MKRVWQFPVQHLYRPTDVFQLPQQVLPSKSTGYFKCQHIFRKQKLCYIYITMYSEFRISSIGLCTCTCMHTSDITVLTCLNKVILEQNLKCIISHLSCNDEEFACTSVSMTYACHDKRCATLPTNDNTFKIFYVKLQNCTVFISSNIAYYHS